MFLWWSQHADDFVWVNHSALAHAHDLLVVFRQWAHGLHFVGGAERNQHSPAGRRRNTNGHIPQLAGLGTGNAGTDHDLLESDAFYRGGKPLHNVTKFVAFQCERLPYVEENTIPVEALFQRPVRLEITNSGSRFGQHAFQVWQRNDATGLVAAGGYVANFGHSEKPFVFGVIFGHRSQQIDVLDRR